MEALRQWLLGAIACAMLASVAAQLCPEGWMRRAARFTGALLILLALLKPLAGGVLAPGAWDVSAYREEMARAQSAFAPELENTLRRGIAEGAEAYIEDKARSLGTQVSASVTVEACGETYRPSCVTIRGPYSEELETCVTRELGIAKEKQTWIESG